MRYIRVRASIGAVVVPSRRFARGLSVLAVSFAPACVPTADLSSYSSAASDATADLGGDRAPSPTRSPTARPAGGESAGSAPGSGESTPGVGAPLDPGVPSDAPGSSSPDDGMVSSGTGQPDAGRRPDAGPPVIPRPLDAATPRPPACALEESTGPNGRCYLLVATPLDWEAARADCQRRGLGWDLASIRSAADSSFVVTLIDDETWVGGSDEATEETWAWVDDGFEFWQGEGIQGRPLNGAFVNWFDDEPNGSTSSDCMRLLDDSRWADLECTELRPFVCEGPPS